MEVRSYRAVFDLERRIYRIDRVRLNPGGMPLRGVVCFFALALLCACLSALPGVSALAGAVPWYMREIALPGGLSALLTILRVDGRPFHVAGIALLAYLLRPRLTLGCGRPLGCTRWQPDRLLVLPDGSEGDMRRLSYAGPGSVLVAAAHERWELRAGPLGWLGRPAQVVLRPLRGRTLTRPQLIELPRGGRLRIR